MLGIAYRLINLIALFKLQKIMQKVVQLSFGLEPDILLIFVILEKGDLKIFKLV